MRTLMSPPVLLCWSFFLFVAMGQMGLMTFVPTLMKEIYSFELEAAGAFVSVMIGAVMTGVLCGGYLADNFRKPDVIVTIGYFIATFMVACIWYFELVRLAAFRDIRRHRFHVRWFSRHANFWYAQRPQKVPVARCSVSFIRAWISAPQ